MQESLQNLTALIVAQCSEVDHTKLHTGYICRICVALLEKYHSTLKNLGANLTTALPILPKTLSSNPLPAPISAPLEISTQSSMASRSRIAASTISPEVTVRKLFMLVSDDYL